MRLVVIFAGLLCLAACSDTSTGSGSTPEALSDASAAGAQTPPAAPDPLVVGEKIYGEFCFSCHTPGLNAAPRLGDAEGWAPRIAKGEALLLQSTIEGIPPAMPPRGICMSCSDEELAAAISYMIAESQ